MAHPALHNTKVFFSSEQDSRSTQEVLFKLGYGWDGGKHFKPKYTDRQFIFLYDSGSILMASDRGKDYFDKHKNREVQVWEILELVEIKTIKDEEINDMLSSLDNLI